mmetsp:Transcript_19408/g.45185  ORF Transcript_19408/g.45185 Transcript_19408/m.45185 type:complete len:787 (+) Transcript_19408:138-2498(+)
MGPPRKQADSVLGSNAAQMGKEEEGKDSWRVSREEAAFILGKGGRTKAKLVTVSGAQIELSEIQGKGAEPGAQKLDISGTAKQRERATKYIGFVTAQRLGPVHIPDPENHDDLTIMLVPANAVSFITGKQGSFLRIVEEEWGALLFFLQVDPKRPSSQTSNPRKEERLAIFGPERARRGAELKVLAAIAMKQGGVHPQYTDIGNSVCEDDDFGTDTLMIEADDYSYVLGKNGSTRKKLSQAANSIVEYIGNVAYFSGTKKERSRAREYFTWLLHQRHGIHTSVEHQGRDDATLIMVPRNLLSFINGPKGEILREIETNTNTFCFIQRGSKEDDDHKPLLIFGRAEDRQIAEVQIWDRISQRYEWRGKDTDTSSEHDPQSAILQGLAPPQQMMVPMPCQQQARMAAVWVPMQVQVPPPSSSTSEVLQFMPEDFAFIVGDNGQQLKRIATVSGATLERWQSGFQLKCTGGAEERRLAQVAITLLLAQNKGQWTMDTLQRCHEFLTCLQVPSNMIGQHSGRQGVPLPRQIEEEFKVLVFVLPIATFIPGAVGDQVLVLGQQRRQRGAELRILQRVEIRRPGLVTGSIHAPSFCESPGFGTDVIAVAEEDQSYSLGRGGQTLRKISKASECIIEYVGPFAFFAGTSPERQRAKEYLGWLLKQRVGPVTVWNKDQRDDCTVIRVPKDCVGFVTGQKGASLHAVEEASSTFCFIEGERDDPAVDPKTLLVFGSSDGRAKAEEVLLQMVRQKMEELQAGKSGDARAPWSGGPAAPGKGTRPKRLVQQRHGDFQ